jgi:hypothetical protein
VSSAPFENFTFGRSLNSQVVSSTARQELASSGWTFCSAFCPTSPSKTWRRSALFGPRLWKCGSIEVGSDARPIFSSWAAAGATSISGSPASASILSGFILFSSWRGACPAFLARIETRFDGPAQARGADPQ